jgi:hypothetical protein
MAVVPPDVGPPALRNDAQAGVKLLSVVWSFA